MRFAGKSPTPYKFPVCRVPRNTTGLKYVNLLQISLAHRLIPRFIYARQKTSFIYFISLPCCNGAKRVEFKWRLASNSRQLKKPFFVGKSSPHNVPTPLNSTELLKTLPKKKPLPQKQMGRFELGVKSRYSSPNAAPRGGSFSARVHDQLTQPTMFPSRVHRKRVPQTPFERNVEWSDLHPCSSSPISIHIHANTGSERIFLEN